MITKGRGVSLYVKNHFLSVACDLNAVQLVFAYPDIRYPDLSVNFMAVKNLDILK